MQTTIKIPKKIRKIFSKPRGELRYRIARGGRGSGKSFNFALMAAIFGATEKLRILCVREFQNSIKESFYAEVKSAIESQKFLADFYEIKADSIRGQNGTEFFFKGLSRNVDSVKSMAQVDICIVEEAETVPSSSWKVLIPTIRAPKSEIWLVYNPESENSSTNKRFYLETPPRSICENVNWSDNPFFPSVLNEERLHALQTLDYATYSHIWEGEYLEMTDAQVFKDKYEIKEFTPDFTYGEPLYGLDFGFSQDPTVAVKVYIKDSVLYVYQCAGRVGLELDDTAKYLTDRIEGIDKYTVRADSARPESISYLARNGLTFIKGVKKGAGSVDDGIAFMKSFKKIVIHVNCQEVAKEFKLYKYKTDKRTGDILPTIIDAHNHYIDALRYSLEPLMRGQNTDYTGLI